jgi:branched-chain amino acid transport system permease protein
VQILLNGLISGLAIALLAVAFQLVYLPSRVFFVALAGLYALAPYMCHAVSSAGGPWGAAVLASVGTLVALALAFERWNHAPLARKGASEGAHLISSLGLYIVTIQVVAMLWGNETRTLRAGIDATFHLSGAVLTWSQVLMAGVAGVMLLGLLAMLRATDLGLRLRALADNPVLFALYGYNVDANRLAAFGLSGVFAASASLLTAYDLGFDPHTGLHAVLLAVVAVIVGGRSSFAGPVAGGLLLGLVRAQVVWHLSARWQEAITFAILALFLLLRPQGLFGQDTRIEATS